MFKRCNQFIHSFQLISAGLLICSCSVVSAQELRTISGKVKDVKTGEPIFFVNVFLAYTNVGTTTDSEGNFTLKVRNLEGVFSLVFQHIAYQREVFQVELNSVSLKYNIELKPSILEGMEVEVEASEPKEWKKNLQLFTKEFIGTSSNAKKCKLINPEILNFKKDSLDNVFTAKTNDLLIVENDALGYRLKISLSSFQIVRGFLNYKIYPLIKEQESGSGKDKRNWERNRRETFEGSRRHFLACLYNPDFRDRNRFKIYKAYRNDNNVITNQWKNFPVQFSSLSVFASELPNVKRFSFDECIVVTYEKSISRKIASVVILEKPYALIDQFGNVHNPLALSVSDDWAQQRVADTLPLDYIPGRYFTSKQ